MRMRRLLTLIAASALLSGCGSILNLTHQRTNYGGVSMDLACFSFANTREVEPWTPIVRATGGLALLWVPIDIPLSLIGDTLLLPITATLGPQSDDDDEPIEEAAPRAPAAESP